MPQTGVSRRKRRDQVPGFSPLNLFAASEVGLWYDPSDLTPEKLAWVAANPGFTSAQFLAAFPTHTLYQNSTGTTPVTALGQPVGLVIDKSKGGLAALGATVLTNGTFATDSDWTKGTGWSIGSGVATKSAGSAATLAQSVTVTANTTYQLQYTLTRTAGTITPRFTGTTTVSATARSASGTYLEYFTAATGNNNFEFSADASFAGTVDDVTVRAVPGVHATQATDAARPTLQARANLLTGTTTLATQTLAVLAAQHTLSFTGTGTVTLSGTSTAGPLVGTGVGQRVSLTFTPTTGNLTLTVSGTVTDAQLERSAAFTVYQRVTTATDYADVGLPRALTFDGTDDSLVTPSVNFTATDKMTVCAGVFKQSDAASAMLVELSATSSAAANNFGSFAIAGPGGNGDNAYNFGLRGDTGRPQYNAVTYTAPITNVITTRMDLAAALGADEMTIRVNGVVPTLNTVDAGPAGGGNFGNYPLFIGSRNQASVRLNGRIHQLIVRGAATDTATIQQTERFVAQRTGVTL